MTPEEVLAAAERGGILANQVKIMDALGMLLADQGDCPPLILEELDEQATKAHEFANETIKRAVEGNGGEFDPPPPRPGM